MTPNSLTTNEIKALSIVANRYSSNKSLNFVLYSFLIFKVANLKIHLSQCAIVYYCLFSIMAQH